MELTFNKIFVMNNLGIFYGFLFSMLLGIIIAIILVLKELKKKDDNKWFTIYND